MNRALFLAILSMDSYNRGYGQGIKADFLPAGRLGNAMIGEDALTLLSQGAAQAAGFYAIAYNWNGETIIAYRGSDNIGKGVAFANFLGRIGTLGAAYIPTDEDITNGYGVAFGHPNGPQARLASFTRR